MTTNRMVTAVETGIVNVGVGSGNPVKRRAVERVLDDRVDSVQNIPVDSDVPDQPRGHEETHRGAVTRAERAFQRGEFDLGVGLEGGVSHHAFTDGLFVIMWGAATDGERICRASGPQFRLPDTVAEAVMDGRELGPVLDDVLGRTGTKYGEGAAGVVTDGLTDRSSALGQAVAGAVGPLLR